MMFINVLHYLCDISYYFLKRRAQKFSKTQFFTNAKRATSPLRLCRFFRAGFTGLTRIFYGRDKILHCHTGRSLATIAPVHLLFSIR